jgi:hypothetical protein
MGITPVTPATIARDTAERSIKGQLDDKGAGIRAQRESTEMMYATFGDKSKLVADEQAKAVAAVVSQFDKAEASILRNAAANEANARTVGMSAGAIARERAEAQLLEAAQQSGIEVIKDGIIVNGVYWNRIQADATRAGDAVQKFRNKQLESQLNFGSKTALFSDQDVHIAQQLEFKYGKDIPAALASTEAAQMRATAATREMGKVASTAFAGLTNDILSGVNGMDALINRLGAAGKSLTEMGTKSVFDTLKTGLGGGGFNFDPMSLAAGAAGIGISLVSNYLAGQKKAEEEAQKAKLAFAGMGDKIHDLNVAASGFDASPIVGAINQIKNSALDLIKAAMAAGETGKAIEFIFTAVKGINSQIDQYITPKGTDTASLIAQENANAQQIIDTMNSLNAQYHLGLNRENDIRAAAFQHIADIETKAQQEIDQRRATFAERVFAAANDDAAPEKQKTKRKSEQRGLTDTGDNSFDEKKAA